MPLPRSESSNLNRCPNSGPFAFQFPYRGLPFRPLLLVFALRRKLQEVLQARFPADGDPVLSAGAQKLSGASACDLARRLPPVDRLSVPLRPLTF